MVEVERFNFISSYDKTSFDGFYGFAVTSTIASSRITITAAISSLLACFVVAADEVESFDFYLQCVVAFLTDLCVSLVVAFLTDPCVSLVGSGWFQMYSTSPYKLPFITNKLPQIAQNA
jgi:hypothetical protein